MANDRLLGMAEAGRLVGEWTGRSRSPAAVWRWCRKGLRGIRLEYVRVGKLMYTTSAWLQEFFRASAETDDQPEEKPEANSTTPGRPRAGTVRQRQREIRQAAEALAAEGL